MWLQGFEQPGKTMQRWRSPRQKKQNMQQANEERSKINRN